MFGSIGMPELIVIFVIALVVFGPRRLPELGRSLGRTVNEFKRASSNLQETWEREVNEEASRTSTAPRSGEDGTDAARPQGAVEATAALHSEFSEQLSRSANGELG